MQDEELDKIVREAATQHHPPYDDKAWNKMRQLLDKQLPQKKDLIRRRILFLLLSLMSILGAFFYTFVYPRTKASLDTNAAIQQRQNVGKEWLYDSVTLNNSAIPITASGRDIDLNASAVQSQVSRPDPVSTKKYQAYKRGVIGSYNNNTVSATKNTGNLYVAQSAVSSPNKGCHINSDTEVDDPLLIDRPAPPTTNFAINKKNTRSSVKAKASLTYMNPLIKDDPKKKDKEPIDKKYEERITDLLEKGDEREQVMASMISGAEKPVKPMQGIDNKKLSSITAEKEKIDPAIDKKAGKKKSGFSGNFGISASVGTDLSYVRIGKLGKATFMYGAGLSYTVLNGRSKIRSGFYVADKVYTASPSDYGGGRNYPFLNSINGECKVYEIPVSFNYNFLGKRKHNWFASAGLSTFIMKKEYYDYIYKYPEGIVGNFEKAIDNKNKHFFSVLMLSAGYQYDPTPMLSFMAEPFVKLPLKGVGNGKIKLNSTGLLITATVKPFAKKNK